MDNENTRFEFVNGSTITSRYEPYQDFQYVDTRTPFDTIEITSPHGVPVRMAREYNQRGHRSHSLIYDEFANFDILEGYTEPLVISQDEMQSRFNKWWYEVGQYEFSIDRDKITMRQKETPDFGELSPSQELNDFVNTLVRGE